MQASASERTPLLPKEHPSNDAAPLNNKDEPVQLFPPRIYFIADLLENLKNQIGSAYWPNICKHIYVPIFDVMDLLKISADGKISGQRGNGIQLDFQSLLAIIADIKANLATSCKGMDEGIRKKIAASLDELKQRSDKYIRHNFPNYTEEPNKKTNVHIAAIKNTPSIASLSLDNDEKEEETESSPLFPSNTHFIADLLKDLQSQIHRDYWPKIYANVYVPIFTQMRLLKISVDEKIFGQQDDGIQIDFPFLLILIANRKADLATFCKGIDKKVIDKFTASLDELEQRLVNYIRHNFSNYVKENNKKADEYAAAIKSAIRPTVQRATIAITPAATSQNQPNNPGAGSLDADEKKTEKTPELSPLFPSNIYFITDLLQDLRAPIYADHLARIHENVYIPIFNQMRLLKISADEKISGQEEDETKINFASLLVTIDNLKENLANSCKGINKEIIKKIATSLDALSQRLIDYICQNFPNSDYAKEYNEDAKKHAAAMNNRATTIRDARFGQARDILKIVASAVACCPVTFFNCICCCLAGDHKLEERDCYDKNPQCCNNRVTPANPYRFLSPITSMRALAADYRKQGGIIKQNQAAPPAQSMGFK